MTERRSTRRAAAAVRATLQEQFDAGARVITDDVQKQLRDTKRELSTAKKAAAVATSRATVAESRVAQATTYFAELQTWHDSCRHRAVLRATMANNEAIKRYSKECDSYRDHLYTAIRKLEEAEETVAELVELLVARAS